MKRFIYAFVFCCLAFVSCNDTVDGDKFVKMEWEKVPYQSQTINKVDYYTVPKEGGVYTFVCTNWISKGVSQYNVYDLSAKNNQTENTYTEVTTNDKTVTITIAPNDTITRYSYVEFNDRVAYGSIKFVQEGAK